MSLDEIKKQLTSSWSLFIREALLVQTVAKGWFRFGGDLVVWDKTYDNAAIHLNCY